MNISIKFTGVKYVNQHRLARIGAIRFATSLLVIALSILPLSANAQPQVTFTTTERQITYTWDNQDEPSISGDLIVYTTYQSGDADIWYFDPKYNTGFPVTSGNGDQAHSDISDGLLVYDDVHNRDVRGFFTRDYSPIIITDETGYGLYDSAVGQGLVAWSNLLHVPVNNAEIYAQDLTTGIRRRITVTPDVEEKAAVDHGTIVWQRCPEPNSPLPHFCDIFAYNWVTDATQQLTATPDGDERLPDVDSRRVVYEGMRAGEQDIYVFDLVTGEEKRLVLPGPQSNPSISGEYVAFEDTWNDSPPFKQILLWHIPTGLVFTASVGASSRFDPDIDGNRIVYTDDRNFQRDVYLVEFQVTFPQFVASCGGYDVYEISAGEYIAPNWGGVLLIDTNTQIIGTDWQDLILGLDSNDKLDGQGGDDVICGGAGSDQLSGGAGNDYLDGGAGNDLLKGGAGNDHLDGDVGNDLLEGGEGDDYLSGGIGNDLLRGQQGDYDVLWGGEGNDGLFDPDGVDDIHGELGNDVLTLVLRNGWRRWGSSTSFVQALSGGYGDDTVRFTILDSSSFWIDISGDEFGDPVDPLDGPHDSLFLDAHLDSLSTIRKFEQIHDRTAEVEASNLVGTSEQQYATEYGFILGEEAGDEESEAQNQRLFLPLITR